MKQTTTYRACLIALCLSLFAPTGGSQATNYDHLVSQAQADLKAGNTAQALTESQEAIASAPSRWEAYVVAGGALQVEKQYDKAIDAFTHALKLAPQAKQAAVQGLLEKSKTAQATAHTTPAPAITPSTSAVQPASESSVSQAEVVLWKTIQDSTNPSDFQAYLQQYPKGAFAALARKAMAPELYQQGLAMFRSGNTLGSFHDFQEACDAQYFAACVNLGQLYELGQGVVQNVATAAQLYKKACDQNISAGCVYLGTMYQYGKGEVKSIPLAAQFYQAACNGGSTAGCFALGNLYYSGEGWIRNLAAAAQLYQKACDGGYATGCANLSWLYANGQGVAQDAAIASQFRQKACTLGVKADCAQQ